MAEETNIDNIADCIKQCLRGYYGASEKVNKHYEKFFEYYYTIIEADGNEIPLESSLVSPIEKEKHTPYTRVGDIILLEKDFFFEEYFEDNMGYELSHPNIISILKHDKSFWPINVNFTALAIQALKTIDLKGEGVLDLGCGRGALSIVAGKDGAEKVFGVDYERLGRRFYQQCKEFNGIDCKFIHGNIIQSGIRKWLDKPPSYINKIPKEDISIVVANIGPTRRFKDAHFEAIKSLDYLYNVHTYIGSGYFRAPKAKEKHILDPSEALKWLRERGFKEISELKIYGKDKINHYVAFVAKR